MRLRRTIGVKKDEYFLDKKHITYVCHNCIFDYQYVDTLLLDLQFISVRQILLVGDTFCVIDSYLQFVTILLDVFTLSKYLT